MPDQPEAPKIQIDSDWKAQAKAEREKLAEKAKTAAPAGVSGGTGRGAAGMGGMPPASFETLLSTMATQALFAMGHLVSLQPWRLGTFFPGLLFGWLRERTGGLAAPIVLHALSNLFIATLEASFYP